MEYKAEKITIKGIEFDALTVNLPKTNLLVVSNNNAYFMCGALDVKVFNQDHLRDRRVICGKALGVKTIEDLINAPLFEVTSEALELGIFEGMLVKDALLLTY